MPLRRFTRPAPNLFLPPRRRLGSWCVALALFATTACSRSQHRSGNPAANTTGAAESHAVAQAQGANAATGALLGTVHVIGTARRFVLVETPSYQPVSVLVDGQALVCRAAGVVTSTLRVSHERRPPFVVADVAAGEPHVGDEVFIDAAPSHTVLPASVSSPLFPSADVPPVAPTPDFRTNPALPPPR